MSLFDNVSSVTLDGKEIKTIASTVGGTLYKKQESTITLTFEVTWLYDGGYESQRPSQIAVQLDINNVIQTVYLNSSENYQKTIEGIPEDAIPIVIMSSSPTNYDCSIVRSGNTFIVRAGRVPAVPGIPGGRPEE